MAVHRSTQALLLKCISSVNAKSVHISGILEQQLDGERRISEILTSKLSPLKLTVQDISGKVCNHNLVLLCALVLDMLHCTMQAGVDPCIKLILCLTSLEGNGQCSSIRW